MRLSVTKNATFASAMIMAALLGLASLAHAADPGESYQRAYVLCDAGMKEAEAGHRDAALGKLKAAQALMQKISQSQPQWQPALVAYKLHKIENLLKDLDSSPALSQEVQANPEAVVASP